MKIKLVIFLFYTFFLLHYPVNLSRVDDRLSVETKTLKLVEEDGEVKLRGSSTIEKPRMMRYYTNKYNTIFISNPKVFKRVDGNFNSTEGNLDIIFEDKKREDAYKRTAAENSPHSLMLAMAYPDTYGMSIMICTGSLVTRSWVLTAAHCMIKGKDKASNATLYAGGNSLGEIVTGRLAEGSQIQVSTEFYIHPDFKDKKSYDVAVVKSPQEFQLTKTVNIINISDQPWDADSYKECTITGFGLVNINQTHEDDYTRKTQQLKIESPCHCASLLNWEFLAGTYLCSKAVEDYGLCTGDSGGGLVCDGVVRGIVMFMVGLTNEETCEVDASAVTRCGGKNAINIFQDSYLVRDWLKSILTPPSVDEPETTTITDIQTPETPTASHSQTPTTPADSHGCNIKLAIGLLTLSMIINII